MGVGNQYFDVAATYLKRAYGNPTSLAVRPGIQSYIATTQEKGPFLLQFRPRERALLDAATQNVVQNVLGRFAPSVKLLGECDIGEKSYLVYEQSIIPGEAFSHIWGRIEVLPRAAEDVGRLLAKCLIPSSSSGKDRWWYGKAMQVLEKACNTTDPLLMPYKSDFVEIRDAVAAGGLDELPLAVTNGDVSALNILATEDGEVCGLVDWESSFYDELPLGTELSCVRWIKSRDRGDRYEDYENTPEIEARFWKGFFLSIPGDVAANRMAFQHAMKLCVVLRDVHNGASNFPMGAPTLRTQLDYMIPPPSFADGDSVVPCT